MAKILYTFAAIAAAAALCACDQSQEAPDTSQQGGQQGDGYGPFNSGTQGTPPQGGPFQGAGGGGEGIISGGGANAPAEFQSVVISYLDRYTTQMAPGWPRVNGVPDTVIGLEQNGEHRIQVSLRGGRSYAFIGACDNECSNIDLILEDARGGVVGSDVLADDYPLVEVTPPNDGAYTLRVQLKSCSIAPCYVAARLVARP